MLIHRVQKTISHSNATGQMEHQELCKISMRYVVSKETREWSSHYMRNILLKLHHILPLQVNGIAFHPVHCTLSTVGSDGRFSFWDKDARTKLKTSDQLDQPITACTFNGQGQIFAYASSYDWSKVRNSMPLAMIGQW